MAIGGTNYNDITIPRWSEIDYAAAGRPFNDATQAGSFGIRKDGKLAIKSVVRKDAIGREQTDAFTAELDLEVWQDDVISLQNFYLLSTQNHNIRLKVPNGDWYNFVDNTANPPFVTPNGSALMGMSFGFECDPKNLALKAKYMTKMHPKEFDWLTSNAASGATGGTGGATVGALAHMAYDQTKYGIPGIQDVLIGSDSLGILQDSAKISLNFKAIGNTVREQPITRLIEVVADIDMWQSVAATEFATLATDRNADFTTTFKLWNGLSIICVNSCSVTIQGDLNDTKNVLKAHFTGVIPYDPVGQSTNVVFNTGGNSLTLNRAGYV